MWLDSLWIILREMILLYDLLSAFREGHSTESALIKLTDQILFDLDQDKVTGMVSEKAFDLVDHQLLLTELRLYRLSESALSWFQSYVTDRHQFEVSESVNFLMHA